MFNFNITGSQAEDLIVHLDLLWGWSSLVHSRLHSRLLDSGERRS